MKGTISSFLICGAILLAPAAGFAVPLGTQFTYQGRLEEAGSPYNGTADLRFSLHNAEVAGAQVGVTIAFEGLVAPAPSPPNGPRVNVVDGLFQVELDFGVAVFNGDARWLQVQARVPSGVGGFVTLTPRQEVTAAPYALQTRGLFVEQALNVGIGTTDPATKLHIVGGTDAAPAGGGFIQLGASNTVNVGLDNNEIMARNNGVAATLFLNANGGDIAIASAGMGDVGIGTSLPESDLHILRASAGAVTAQGNSPLVVENSTHAYLNLLTPDAAESGVLFGSPINNAAGGVIYNNASTPDGLQFRTNGNVNRMIVSSTGDVGIGTTSPDNMLDVNGHVSVTTSVGDEMIIKNDDVWTHSSGNQDFGDGGDHFILASRQTSGESAGVYGGGDALTLWSPGDSENGQPAALIYVLDEDFFNNDGDPYNGGALRAYLNSAGVWVASDIQRKHNLAVMSQACEKIEQLSAYTYEYLPSAEDAAKGEVPKRMAGLIAQEVMAVLPEAVDTNADGEHFLNYTSVVPLLVQSVKELNETLAAKQAQIDAMEARLTALENRLIVVPAAPEPSGE